VSLEAGVEINKAPKHPGRCSRWSTYGAGVYHSVSPVNLGLARPGVPASAATASTGAGFPALWTCPDVEPSDVIERLWIND
jgi:hypothetical protein